jgi:methylase of polypeptide subunit release factors
MKQTKLNPLYLVNRVNEIYHDIEREAYLQKHPEIFVDEAKRWRRIAKRYLVKDCSITVLDIGTGIGFIPLTIAPFLKMEDTIICSDISFQAHN